MFDFTFAHPQILFALILLPLILVWYYKNGKEKRTKIIYSNFQLAKASPKTVRAKLSDVPMWLRMLSLGLIIVALARPQSFSSGENVYSEGIDIVLVLDISSSMLAEDFKPNRLDAAKKITDAFISARETDRIGLVVFSRDAFTQCPITIDYSVLRNLLLDVKSGMVEDGTAIGNAIANGVNRLRESKAKSKTLILLTDGVNNAGEIDPTTAAEIAKQFGVRIYSIGIGTMGEAPYPFQTPFGIRYQMVKVEIDETLLKKISTTTGGKYFRATGNKKLEEIYKEIDKLEKTKIEITSFRSKSELFKPWLLAALIILALELLLSKTYLRKLP